MAHAAIAMSMSRPRARLPDLEKLSRHFDLPIVSVADLISYRMMKDTLVRRGAEAPLPTAYGEFRAVAYENDVGAHHHVALVEEAKDLLAHALPSATLAEIHLRAMRTLVTELKKRKFAVRAPSRTPSTLAESPGAPVRTRSDAASLVAESAGPAAPVSVDPPNDSSRSPKGDVTATHVDAFASPPRQRGRTVSASVRRSVLERDGHRCAYVDERGVRCRETHRAFVLRRSSGAPRREVQGRLQFGWERTRRAYRRSEASIARARAAGWPAAIEEFRDTNTQLGGFLGVILGVTLSACGTGDDSDTGATASASSGTAGSTATGNDSTGFETAQPLYGPVITSGMESGSTDTGATTFPETSGPLYGPITTGEDATETDGDTSTGGESTGTDTGASSSSDSAAPLYGPVSG